MKHDKKKKANGKMHAGSSMPETTVVGERTKNMIWKLDHFDIIDTTYEKHYLGTSYSNKVFKLSRVASVLPKDKSHRR